jgi:voltage-gated potassium channel
MAMLTRVIILFNTAHRSYKKAAQTGLLPLIIPFLILIIVGTFVYARLENWTLIESLYATIITITTVGYGDFSPQTVSGRIFAIFFTLFAIGLAGYSISAIAAVIFEGQQTKMARKRLERRMKRIANLRNHVIICGGGILGNRAAAEFKRRNFPFVIIESDEEKLKRTLLWMHEGYVDKRLRHYESLDEVDLTIEEDKSVAELAEESNVLYILEDPTDEQQLRVAGIHKAYGVIAAMEDDRDNTTIILSAQDMGKRLGNKNLRVVASARDELNMHTLYLAGADRVVSPNIMGGFTVASQMLDHDAAEFWDQMLFQHNQNMRFGDMKMEDYPKMVGQTAQALKQSLSQLVIAIRRDGQFVYAPNPDEILQADDVLIVLGPELTY